MPASPTISPDKFLIVSFSLKKHQPTIAVMPILIALDTGNSITESTVLPNSVTR